MHSNFTYWLVMQQRQADLLREAQQTRLARLALAGRPRHDHFYCRAFVELGRRLVRWGWRLQERHDVISVTQTLAATHDAL
jgi:hypothetical protein